MERTRALRQQILRPHQSLAELASHEPPDAFAVGTLEDGELVSVGLIGREGEPGEWRVRGMATLPSRRGRGAGSSVLSALLDHAAGQGATAVWCTVRTPARTLYERAGFEAVSEEYEMPQIGPHVVMRRQL
ncbi:MAG: GNAT family N-acetyltransferase [Solirubrobacteraceae bacterium]